MGKLKDITKPSLQASDIASRNTSVTDMSTPSRLQMRIALKSIDLRGVSAFSLVLSAHPPAATKFDFPSAILSDLSGNVSPRIQKNRERARLALMRGKVYIRLAAPQNR